MFLNTNKEIYEKISKMVEHYGMPFLLERNVSVVVREESNEENEEARIRYTSFTSSVKRSKDGEIMPPRVALSRVEDAQDSKSIPGT